MNARIVFLLLLGWLIPAAHAADSTTDYKLAAGDVLRKLIR